jgi:hypothetical protein
MALEACAVIIVSRVNPEKRHLGIKNLWIKNLSIAYLFCLMLAAPLQSQTCLTAADIEPATGSALEATAKRYFDMSTHGDSASLKQNAIPSLAADFSGVEGALTDNQPSFASAHAVVRPPFQLNAESSDKKPFPRAEFLCGVFGASGQTSQSAVFVLNDLPAGKYAVAILDVTGGKKPLTLTLVLQQIGSDWKLAGYYARSQQVAGHDAAWFAQQARDFKGKGQHHNAWLYYREAIALASPVDFMSTQATDKLYDEIQAVQPADMPANGNAVDLSAGGKTYRLTAIFPLVVADDLDVVIRYSAADISNPTKTFEENMLIIKAFVAKFPELKSAFTGVVARAVAPSGEDYGSMLPMKEVK